ncbi:hypothetical protein DL96DRAFT_523126 [Flagelloscypha sp. PMI_526]|nr:hypothetical protein DL96DRAFT_523126 [Flagelloscypha sp. PMI_526]
MVEENDRFSRRFGFGARYPLACLCLSCASSSGLTSQPPLFSPFFSSLSFVFLAGTFPTTLVHLPPDAKSTHTRSTKHTTTTMPLEFTMANFKKVVCYYSTIRLEEQKSMGYLGFQDCVLKVAHVLSGIFVALLRCPDRSLCTGFHRYFRFGE